MNLNELITEYSAIIIVSLGALTILSFILIIILLIKQHKLNKKYKRFMSGEEGKNLEEQILRRFSEIDGMKVEAKTINKEIVSDFNITNNQKPKIRKIDGKAFIIEIYSTRSKFNVTSNATTKSIAAEEQNGVIILAWKNDGWTTFAYGGEAR